MACGLPSTLPPMSSKGSGRKCVFCGASGCNREHLWPRWVQDVLPDEAKMQARVTLSSAESEPRSFQQKPFSATIRAVCSSCNSGWMSDLEVKTKPMLAGMIKGNGRELHSGGQQVIATWAFLKIAMLERVWGIRMIPLDHYRQLYERPIEPPDNVYVWVARVNPTGRGQQLAGFFQGRGLTLGSPDVDLDPSEVSDGYTATFSINHFVVKVFGHQAQEDRELVHLSQVRACLQRIWPIEQRDFVWPPGSVLNGPAGLQLLASGPVE